MARVVAALGIVLAAVLSACGGEPEPTNTPAPTTAATPPASPEPTAQATPAGPPAIDFSLPSTQGPEYTLSSFAGQQPVVVVFYRAFW